MPWRASIRLLILVAVTLAAVPPTPAAAQIAGRSVSVAPAAAFSAQESGGRGGRAFLIEAAGGTTGSLLGFTAVYALADDCPVEDLGCHLETAFAGIALGTGVAALGGYLAGRLGETQPSGLGATLGAILGAAAGLGAWHLFTEELDAVNDRVPATLVYSVTQGVFTGLGSRVVRALR